MTFPFLVMAVFSPRYSSVNQQERAVIGVRTLMAGLAPAFALLPFTAVLDDASTSCSS